MNRVELEIYITETYHIQKDYPWSNYPNYAVFRHSDNKKWFAIMMDIPKMKLGLEGDSLLSVVNLKCDPHLIGSLRAESGFFPAYHMNKENWITVALDDSVPDEKIQMLVDMSFEATAALRKLKK